MLSEPIYFHGTERNIVAGNLRYYLILFGTQGISENEKDYQESANPAYTAYISAYIKSIFDFGNCRNLHFLAIAIYYLICYPP